MCKRCGVYYNPDASKADSIQELPPEIREMLAHALSGLGNAFENLIGKLEAIPDVESDGMQISGGATGLRFKNVSMEHNLALTATFTTREQLHKLHQDFHAAYREAMDALDD